MCGYASRSAAASLGSALTITTGCPATTPASGTRVCCGTSVSSMNHLSRTLQASQPTSKEYSVVPGRLSAQRCAVSCSASPSILAAPLSMRARNAHFHHHRSWPQVPTSRAGRTPLGQCPIGATTRRCGGILPQSSSALTNAAGSNGARSSGPSPRPTSFTGTPSSRCTWKTMPPFAVPSSSVSTMPVTSTTSANTRACANPFWPVVASNTNSTSSTGACFSTTRLPLPRSSIRPVLVCSLPAVSTSTASAFASLARFTASNATEAGSAPSLPRTTSAPTRCDQVSSWSAAAARNVSAAPSNTCLPWATNTLASLPVVVVLPVPFTPATSSTAGCCSPSTVCGNARTERSVSAPSVSVNTSRSSARASSAVRTPLADSSERNFSTISVVVSAPRA